MHPIDSSKIACGTNDGYVSVYNNVDDRESLDSDTFLQIRVSKKDNVSIENVQKLWNLTTDEKKDDMETNRCWSCSDTF